MSLQVTDRRDASSQVGFDVYSRGLPARDPNRAYMAGPAALNTVPPVVQGALSGKATIEVVCLTDIDRLPATIVGLAAENVDTFKLKVFRSDGV